MKPILHFAVFAEKFVPHEHNGDLLGIHNRIDTFAIDHAGPGVAHIPKTLFVSIIADIGIHTLKCKHRESPRHQPFEIDFEFEILPEHSNSYVAYLNTDFRIRFHDEPIINTYLLFLDEEPLGEAHLIAHQL